MIYVVEDDLNNRELVLYSLKTAGFDGVGFEDSTGFWPAIQAELPDLILLDIMLPGEDGLHILSKLKQNPKTESVPVILLTAKGSEYDKVIGLDSGADDYVAKPYGIMELLSRIKAVLRRTQHEPKEWLRFRELKVNQENHQVFVEDEEIPLTNKEYDLLICFLNGIGRVFTRDFLLDNIWGYAYDGENRTVDVHIRTLRQKLKQAGKYIETVRGVGYRIGDSKEG